MGKYREETIGGARLILGDCLDVLATLSFVDAVVTDPPYGVGFADWDNKIQTEWLTIARKLASTVIMTP